MPPEPKRPGWRWAAVGLVAVGAVVAVLSRDSGGRDWPTIMERHGTTVDAACAEWLEGVEMYGGEVQFAAVMRAMASPASDPDDLTDDWISYAASHC